MSAKRFKKEPTYKENKETLKEQTTAAVSFDAYNALRKAGYTDKAANDILTEQEPVVILKKVQLLPQLSTKNNPLGALRQLIRDDGELSIGAHSFPPPSANDVDPSRFANSDALQQQRAQRHQEQLAQWHTLSEAKWHECHQQAINQASSTFVRQQLQRHTDLSNPPRQTLAVMADLLQLPVGESA